MKTIYSLGTMFFIVIGFISCKDTTTAGYFDVTGDWSGLAIANDGAQRISAEFVQDTTGSVSGQILVHKNSGDESITISGTVDGSDFEGVTTGGDCPADLSLNIRTSDGNRISGRGDDRPSGDSCNGSVKITMYRDLPANQVVTGTWSGNFKGSNSDGTLSLTVTQSGSTVTGTLLVDDGSGMDTNSFSGRVFGDVMLATATKSGHDVTHILVELTATTMDGIFGNEKDNDNDNGDNNSENHSGTVHLSKSASKIAKANQNPR